MINLEKSEIGLRVNSLEQENVNSHCGRAVIELESVLSGVSGMG